MLSPDDPLAQEILRSIRQLVRSISIHSKSLQRDVGLTVPQVVCLRAIKLLEGGTKSITVAEVSEAVQLSPPTVSRIIERLTMAGLVTRERNTVDRRKVALSLTALGQERLAGLPAPLQETFLQRLEGLPLEERMQLRESLRCLVELMSASDLDAAPLLVPDETV